MNNQRNHDRGDGAVASVHTDKKSSPIKVRLFSLEAIVKRANALAELVKQLYGAQNGSGGFVRANMHPHKNQTISVSL